MQVLAPGLSAAEYDRPAQQARAAPLAEDTQAAAGLDGSASQAWQLRDSTQGRLEHRLDFSGGSSSGAKDVATQQLSNVSSYGAWIHDSGSTGASQKGATVITARASASLGGLQQPHT